MQIMPRRGLARLSGLSGREQPQSVRASLARGPASARHCDELWLSVLGRGLPDWHCRLVPRHLRFKFGVPGTAGPCQ